ncbi:hypothetical protein [Haliscomenobacter sp.]|uniref:hypothetical protein n=1 Tax=Haliscomenobacter sp. TaxID=2717303 RepID=UPI0035931969
MRPYLYHLVVLFFWVFYIAGCKQSAAPVDENARPMAYTEKQLESFLDSIGRLPIEPMVKEARHYSDSVFYSRQNMAVKLSASDYQTLLREAKKGLINEKLARQFHTDYDSSEVYEGKLYASFHPFDKNENQPDQFAICFEVPAMNSEGDVYFFSKNQCISMHHIFHRYGLEMEHYQDEEGKTVIYYRENFASGTGIWWFDYYFYRYEDGKLLPVLSELQNGNLSMIPAYRARWLESTIVDTNPVTLKMVYYLSGENGDYILNDSTNVQYRWDAKTKTLKGDYESSKLSQNQILSYNLGTGNDLFFIRAHYDMLKRLLKDKTKRRLVLYFLNEAKADLNG